jgi:hypothetical protein
VGDSAEIERSETEALLAARRELGPEYDEAFVEAFADRIEQVVAERTSLAQRQQPPDEGVGGRQFVLGIVSLGTGIPITAIAGGTARPARDPGGLGGHRGRQRRPRPGEPPALSSTPGR